MSSCAPVYNFTSDSIYAATCVDIRATGDLADFFVLAEQQKSANFYLLFNEDEIINDEEYATTIENAG